jgi:two-component system chemotaxis response regulator CheY
MRILIVEDDFISRKLMLAYLMSLGECDIAVNGQEALEAFMLAIEEGQPYDLVCLDIMMPEMSGQMVLKYIRQIEKNKGTLPADSVKIIMTSALKDGKNVMEAFNSQCEAYLVKPIDREKLMEQICLLGLSV